jgi:hypothetical protein
MQWAAMEAAQSLEVMNVLGVSPHALKGDEKARRPVWVNGNARFFDPWQARQFVDLKFVRNICFSFS